MENFSIISLDLNGNMSSKKVSGTLSTISYKHIGEISESKRNFEYQNEAQRKENDIGNNTVLSKSDVLPFVLKGNEIRLSEAPTDSTLPILPIFITQSESSTSAEMQSQNSKSSETNLKLHHSQLVSINEKYEVKQHKIINSSDRLFVHHGTEGDILNADVEISSCTAQLHGKGHCSCYKCILSDETYHNIIESPEKEGIDRSVNIDETLNFQTLFDHKQMKVPNDIFKNKNDLIDIERVEKSKNKEVINNDHGNNTPSLLTRSIENLQEETSINVFPHDLYAYSGCFKVRIYLLDCEIIYLK